MIAPLLNGWNVTNMSASRFTLGSSVWVVIVAVLLVLAAAILMYLR